ncbi:MAG TPA: hypothetical protein VNS10_13285 [Gemmatimonadaceae bacterium]|nr:hypothetical protein [Gemmatimonadaceae bacterium]
MPSLSTKMAVGAAAPADEGGGGRGRLDDVVTMERCYDLPDDADILAVTSDPNKRGEAPPQQASA